MTTRKELAEAHGFARRRLVQAFVGGERGTREGDSTTVGRTVVGGAALTVLLLAGAAVAGFTGGRPPSGWLDSGSFVVAETGDQYVVVRGGDEKTAVLNRVPNYVSAQLVLGRTDLDPHRVDTDDIRRIRLGADLGIEGAPTGLPGPDGLVGSTWTACTADGRGVRLQIGDDPVVTEVPAGALLVSTGGDQRWLVAQDRQGTTRSYRLPDGRRGRTLADRLGFAPEAVQRVPAEWLALAEPGDPLDEKAFAVEQPGAVVQLPGAGQVRQGDLLRTPEGLFLVDGQGPRKLSEFAGRVHLLLSGDRVVESSSLQVPAQPAGTPENWPEVTPEPLVAPSGPPVACLVLHAGTRGSGRVSLATTPMSTPAALGVEAGETEVSLAPSSAALVRAAGGAAPDVLVGPRGRGFRLLDDDTVRALGYADVRPFEVPAAWLGFLPPGVDLSVEAARSGRS